MRTHFLRGLLTGSVIAFTLSAGTVAFAAGWGSLRAQVTGARSVPAAKSAAVRRAPAQKAYTISIRSDGVLPRYVAAVKKTGQKKSLRTMSTDFGVFSLGLERLGRDAVAFCITPVGKSSLPARAQAMLDSGDQKMSFRKAGGNKLCADAPTAGGHVGITFTGATPPAGPGEEEGGAELLPPPPAGGRPIGKGPARDPVVVEIEDELKKSFADWKTKLAQDIGLGRTSDYDPNGEPISWEGPGLSLIGIATGKQSVNDELCGELRALLGHLIADVNNSGMEADAKAKALAALQAARADASCTAEKTAQALASAFGVPAGGGGTALQGQVRGLMQLVNALGAQVNAIGKLAGEIQGLAGQIVKAPSDEKTDQLEAEKMKKLDELRNAANGYNNLKSLLGLLILTLPANASGYDYLEALITFPGRLKDSIIDREATARRNALVGEALSDIQKNGRISRETENKIEAAKAEAAKYGN